MITSFTRVRTEHAKDYLAFMFNVAKRSDAGGENDGAHARIRLRHGICEITADDSYLDVAITANSVADAVMLEDIVSDRLDDAVGGDEQLHYQWVMLPQSSRANSSASRRGS